MGRIIDIRTENIADLKILFETLKDVLNDTVITIIKTNKGKDDSHEEAEEAIADEIEDDLKKDKKKSKSSKSKKDKKKKKDDSDDSDSDEDSESESESESSSDDSSESDSSDSESEEEIKKSKKSKKGKKGKKTKGKKTVTKKSKGKGDSKSEELSETSKGKATTQNEDGIKIFNIDDHQILLVFVKLDADKFVKFYSKQEEYTIGVELQPLFKQFKIMDKDGLLTMYVNESEKRYLNMDVENDTTKCITNYQIKMLDLNAKKYTLPPSTFEAVVKMNCAEFHRICRDMHSMACEFIQITCTDKRITFECIGESTKIKKTFENKASSGDDSGVTIKCPKKKKKDSIVIIRNVYELKYLTMFNKCSNICNDVRLYLKNEYAIFMKYSVATLGEMLVGLSPVVEKNLNKNKNYNPANDVHYPRSEIKMKE
jgi:proliferating cell nuclear antigen